MHNEIDDGGVVDVIFANGAGVGMNADDAKRFCAAQQELMICPGGDLVCILILVAKSEGRCKIVYFHPVCIL